MTDIVEAGIASGTEGKLVRALDWKGAEGSALSLHTSDSAGQFKELISESWYRAPM